ncbi:MAG: hypothetical protein ACR2IJ_08970 [Fluviibacter sp.]
MAKSKRKAVMGAEHLAEVAAALEALPVAAVVDITPVTEAQAAVLVAEAVAAAAVLGDDMAAADEAGGDYIARGRALGIFPPVQGEEETGAAYDTRCEAFQAAAPVVGAWKRAYILRAALRKTAAFSLFVEDESTGKCRDAVDGDMAERVRSFTPTHCYLMDADTFKNLPGKVSLEDTVKGRVAASREGMQAIGNTRYSRSRAEAREDGRRVEAATGTPSKGARGGNKTLEQAAAAFFKKGATMAGVNGTDKAQAFKAAFATFVDSCLKSGVMDDGAWKAARGK